MSEIIFINASPRKNGTSMMLCERLQKHLGGEIIELFDKQTELIQIIERIGEADTVIISGPCYVDSYPAKVTLLLEELSRQPDKCHGQKLYGIINGGMPYVHTHESGLHQLEIFADLCNMHYAGGFVIGLGPMLNGQELEKHMCAKKLVPAFHEFGEHIRQGEDSPAALYYKTMFKVPKVMAMLMAK